MRTRLTTTEIERLARLFKDMLAEHPVVRASIITAGIASICDILYKLWLVLRYVARF
jgi:hypothetical protein